MSTKIVQMLVIYDDGSASMTQWEPPEGWEPPADWHQDESIEAYFPSIPSDEGELAREVVDRAGGILRMDDSAPRSGEAT